MAPHRGIRLSHFFSGSPAAPMPHSTGPTTVPDEGPAQALLPAERRYSVRRRVGDAVNSALRFVDLELVRRHRWDDPRTFLPFASTIRRAKEAGLPLCDFIDLTYNVPGATQDTIDRLSDLGVYRRPIQRICEIGPGSGRFLEKTLHRCAPDYYEIYETADDWARWLVAQYNVVYQETDGNSLAATPSGSIDLVQAHKVLVATPFLTTVRYLREMMRVLRVGGLAVFDVMTKGCLDGDTLNRWVSSGITYGSYPALVPEEFVRELFLEKGFAFVGKFSIPMVPGQTQYFVFCKTRPD
jgi:SAM-dependent methyltransferase